MKKVSKRTMIQFSILVVTLIIGISVLSGGPHGGPYTARVTQVTLLPHNYIQVNFLVTNHGSVAGSPSCHIDIQAPYGGSGYDGMSGTNTVQAHSSQSFYDNIVVSNNDATYVTSSMVTIGSC
jgi:hypothetical protein